MVQVGHLNATCDYTGIKLVLSNNANTGFIFVAKTKRVPKTLLQLTYYHLCDRNLQKRKNLMFFRILTPKKAINQNSSKTK